MSLRPPSTRAQPEVESVHGVEIRDRFRWLEASEPPAADLTRWVAAQAAHTRHVLDGYPGRELLVDRLRSALESGALGASVVRGRRRFFSRRAAGAEQASLQVDADGAERCLLDPADLPGGTANAIDWYQVSPDGELVAVGISLGGSERSALRLVATADGRLLSDRIPDCPWSSVAFEPGARSLLYTRFPPGQAYHQRLFRHLIGSDHADDELLFTPAGKTETASVDVSADGRWVALTVHRDSRESSLWLRRAGGQFSEAFRGEGEALHAWFSGDRLLALTNAAAPLWRCVEINPELPGQEAWKDLVGEGPHVLVDVAVSADRMLAHHLVHACSWVSVHKLEGEFEGIIDLPPLSTVTGLGAHPSSSDVFLTLETFTRPATVLRVDPATGRFLGLGGLQSPPGFDHLAHPVRQVEFVSRDGTRSRMFLVGRQEGPGPTLLTGYGGFNLAHTPTWQPFLVPFLEAGGLFVQATLRGGGEYGEQWHRAGMLGSKQNTFDDFIAAAESLIAGGHCSPASLGIRGGSNGGLLVGAAMTQRPELFAAVVCQVPLLDMVRYERFRIAELWTGEYGSASDPEQFGWLHAYSPYHNVTPGAVYPPLLLLTAGSDARVDPGHAYKFAALLQTDCPEGLTLLRVESGAGHGAGKPTAKLLQEEADILCFLAQHLRS